MANASTAGPRDRRTARAERTRAAIVDAHIGLLAEGVLQPTGREIASRAGVSSRSLWVHLTDLEELFTATAAETLARQEARSTRTFRSRRSTRR
jgi:TetR/AcrR family transcriptional regulator of autoinduction and epiphytic fitness